jgi:hypothetical protein
MYRPNGRHRSRPWPWSQARSPLPQWPASSLQGRRAVAGIRQLNTWNRSRISTSCRVSEAAMSVTRWLLHMSDERPGTRPRTRCTHRTNSRLVPNVRSSHRKILRAALRHRADLCDNLNSSQHVDHCYYHSPSDHSPSERGVLYVRYRTLTFGSHGWQANETTMSVSKAVRSLPRHRLRVANSKVRSPARCLAR